MRIGLFGIGNVLMGDDAFGPTVITRIGALWELPENVVLADLGTPSLDLAGRMSDLDAVVIIDAVSASAPAGTLLRYSRAQLLEHPPGLRLSPHEPSLKETLLTLEFLGEGPQTVVLIGVVPERLDGFGMSSTVDEIIPAAADRAIAELTALGVRVQLRSTPLDTTPWWQSASSPSWREAPA